jgi:hypothetical protein
VNAALELLAVFGADWLQHDLVSLALCASRDDRLVGSEPST